MIRKQQAKENATAMNSEVKYFQRTVTRTAGLAVLLLLIPTAGRTAGTEQRSPFALPETAAQDTTVPASPPAQSPSSAFALPDGPAAVAKQQAAPSASPFALPQTPGNTPAPAAAGRPQENVDTETLFNQGTGLARQGQLEEADKILRQVLARDPRHIRAMNNIGLILRRLGHNEEALNMYRQAVATDATYALTYKNMGILLDQMKKYEEAREAYEAYLHAAPDAPDAKAIRERSAWLAAETKDQAPKAGKAGW